MLEAVLAVFAVVLCILFRVLNVNSEAKAPTFYYQDVKFFEHILKATPKLGEVYIPPRLWGFSGHVQTVLHSIIGRVKCPWPIGERCCLRLEDGATVTYDLYNPLDVHVSENDFILAICPGICNCSESIYIRTFVHYSQRKGYRCAVLNHIGTIDGVKVTSPRIFSYGNTGDFDCMVHSVLERYPNTRLILVGFSMGANIIIKYISEKRNLPSAVIGALSLCQGYDATKATEFLLMWTNFRRFYLYVMTENMKSLIMKYRSILLTDDVKKKFKINEREIYSAATVPELDEAYSRRVHGCESLTEFYKTQSCVHYMENLKLPVVFINALDDPLIPEPLLEPVRKFAVTHDDVLFIQQQHGGHLGFYEGGLLHPNPVTWSDRILVDLATGLISWKDGGKSAQS